MTAINVFTRGAVVFDTGMKRVGEIMDRDGETYFLQPLKGGREWCAEHQNLSAPGGGDMPDTNVRPELDPLLRSAYGQLGTAVRNRCPHRSGQTAATPESTRPNEIAADPEDPARGPDPRAEIVAVAIRAIGWVITLTAIAIRK
ncbi:hypothetical protein [Streptomyces katsurahamanus]|uniref:Uncharacterized protein n=1 Tax=Streptomyces katsurahamanus TaxID=2577098 RepID=A0ABW9NYH5_9ACTN|nr:hypothetical protein [Streptomyces katsurahamanus]MQS38320.1 hypothetical protein [Streptomyces katsurahamanus]